MGPVQGNTVYATSGQAANNGDGTYTVPVNVAQALEVNRFENGGLQDLQGYVYPIVDNTESSLRVGQGNNPAPPQSNGDVWFWDDDQLHDGQDVPEPDLGLLSQAFLPAYVSVITPADGGGNPANNQPAVRFDLNVEETERSKQRTDFKNAASTPAYWVIYLQGAFQGPIAIDNDPNAEGYLMGITWKTEGALIYLEGIKDAAREYNVDAYVAERQTVVHEVGHQFDLPDRQDAGQGIMRNDVVIVPREEEKFIEEDLFIIRKQAQAN